MCEYVCVAGGGTADEEGVAARRCVCVCVCVCLSWKEGRKTVVATETRAQCVCAWGVVEKSVSGRAAPVQEDGLVADGRDGIG